MIAVGHLFELNRRKLNDTVLTGRTTGFVDDTQIYHVFQQESVYLLHKLAA